MTYQLTDIPYDMLFTEIMFDTARAKSEGTELVRFDFCDESEKLFANAIKVFKLIKKKGRIQLYAFSRDFETQTTEAKYLLNKYPDISLDSCGKEFAYVKINII